MDTVILQRLGDALRPVQELPVRPRCCREPELQNDLRLLGAALRQFFQRGNLSLQQRAAGRVSAILLQGPQFPDHASGIHRPGNAENLPGGRFLGHGHRQGIRDCFMALLVQQAVVPAPEPQEGKQVLILGPEDAVLDGLHVDIVLSRLGFRSLFHG